MHSTYRLALLIVIALLLAGSARASEGGSRSGSANRGFDMLADVQNGDVILGERASGVTLDGSDRPDGHLLVTIDTPYQVFDEAGTFIHVAAWTPEGEPAAGADVYLSGHLVGRTGEHGALAFRWGVPGNDVESYWLNGSVIDVRLEQGGDTLGGRVWFSAFSRTSSFASDHLFVYTDRGIYNPGQTVHLRFIGWHLAADYSPIGAAGATGREPAAGAEVELVINGPGGRAIAGGNARADDLGTGHLDLGLPATADEGMYELVASYSGARATARLRVERFEPPVIDIQHTLGRFLTRDQEALDFEVELAYFTGGEFTEGTVVVDVLVDGSSVWQVDRAVTGPGPHAFSLAGEALEDLRAELYEDQRIEVQIAAHDTYGRRDDLKRELRYTANPYVAIIEADRDYYSTGDPVELVVRLTDRDRVPVRDREVRLEAECAETQTARTDDGGTAQFSLTMPEGGCQVSVYLADVAVPLASRWLAWQERQPMRSHIADAIVREGEPVRIRVTFPADFVPAEDVVHVDVVDTSGSLVNSVLVPIVREGREGSDVVAEGTFEAPSWGSMLLTLFCLGQREGADIEADDRTTSLGLMTEGQNLAVHPGRELTVHLDGVPDELAPGTDFSGQVRVTDRDGNPIDAAVGAALVDGAVISLQDPLEITPMDLFYNPELRVISTTGSAILTWPVVSRNWGSRTMDVALPPFPYLDGGTLGVASGGDVSFDADDGDLAGVYSYGAGGEMVEAEAAEPMALMAAPPPGAPMGAFEDQMVGGALAEPSAASPQRRLRVSGPAGEPQPVVITIRTEFPETALWEPALRTGADGAVALSGALPDAITQQQFSIVASDGNGGVGVLRRDVQVTQPLFVRSDLPDTLAVGDRIDGRVAVQNLTDVAETVEVTMTSELLEGGARTQRIEVPAHGTGVAVFDVEPSRAGRVRYTIAARTAARHDIEERDTWVRPAGAPTISTWGGPVTADSAFAQAVELPAGGQMTTATLSVGFPAVGAAFAGLDAIRAELMTGDLMALGGEIIATALLYDYRRGGAEGGGADDEVELEAMRQALQSAALRLQMLQRPDGGWGLWWDKASSPYVTGYALDALLTLREVGIAVDDGRITRAAGYLLDARDGQTYDVSAISFWEGNTATVRLGLTAEIFDVLSRVPEALRPSSWAGHMRRLANLFVEQLDAETPDVLTHAHALLGLHRLAAEGVVEVEGDRLVQAARRLTSVRREAHWEPSWFNAYGGTIEATVAVLQVFHTVGGDDGLLDGDLRDTVRYLLSTRDEWGGWHNPRGTAAAIRALTLIAPAGPEIASTVTVLVDGREVASVAVDPDDPYLSAIELRALDLSGALGARPGAEGSRHTIEIVYDGNLELDARLTVRHWGEATPGTSAWLRVEAELEGERAELGQPVDYRVTVTSQSGSNRLVELDLRQPANAVIERASIEQLETDGLIEHATWGADGVRLLVRLAPDSSQRLDVRYATVRPGTADVPAPTARAVVGPGDDAGSDATGEVVALRVE